VEDTSGELAACSCLARCAFGEGQYLKASEYLERSIDLCKRLDDHFRLHAMEANLARVLTSLGDFRAAERCFKNIDAAVQSVSLISRCNYDGSLGYLFVLMRKFEKAAIHILRSRNLAFENGLTRQIATSHEYAGELAFWQGDYAKAEEHYWEAIRIGMEIAPEGDLISQSYRLLAELQVARDQLDDAEESCNRAWTVAEKINERLELGAIRRTRGEIAARRGDAGAAKIAFEESIRILSEIGAKYELARVHLQAGEAGVFSSEYRLTNLLAARTLFDRIGVEYWQERVGVQIKKMVGGEHVAVSRVLQTCSRDKDKSFIAVSPSMQKILAHVEQIKDTDATILLLGETGVGKDRLAEYIHHVSNRSKKLFQIVSVTNYPADLLPGELFGHTRGAFTGADTNRLGLLEAANGGTVYLDEIGEVSEKAQVLLLEFLERKEIRRLGGHKGTRLDVRFIAASNRDLKRAADEGRFRKDLYHRLSQDEIVIPPLHTRTEDIAPLTEYLLTKLGFHQEKAMQLIISPFGEWLRAASWPGNVRQLQNILSRLMNRMDGTGDHELLDLAREVLAEAGLLPDPEREKLLAVLKANDWNQRETARELGMPYTTFRRQMIRLGISGPADD